MGQVGPPQLRKSNYTFQYIFFSYSFIKKTLLSVFCFSTTITVAGISSPGGSRKTTTTTTAATTTVKIDCKTPRLKTIGFNSPSSTSSSSSLSSAIRLNRPSSSNFSFEHIYSTVHKCHHNDNNQKHFVEKQQQQTYHNVKNSQNADDFSNQYRSFSVSPKAITTSIQFPTAVTATASSSPTTLLTPSLASSSSSSSSLRASVFLQRLRKSNRLTVSSGNLTYTTAESNTFRRSSNTLYRVLQEFSGDLLIRSAKTIQHNQKNNVSENASFNITSVS